MAKKTYRTRYDWYFRHPVPDWYLRNAPKREQEVMRLRLEGKKLKEIESIMGITKRCLWQYRINSYRRFLQGDMFEESEVS